MVHCMVWLRTGGGRGQRAGAEHLAAVHELIGKYRFRVSTKRTWGQERIMEHHIILETCETTTGSAVAEIDEDSLFEEME